VLTFPLQFLKQCSLTLTLLLLLTSPSFSQLNGEGPSLPSKRLDTAA